MRDAKNNREKKISGRNPGDEKALFVPRILRANFFLAVFFRVMYDGPGERRTTRSQSYETNWSWSFIHKMCNCWHFFYLLGTQLRLLDINQRYRFEGSGLFGIKYLLLTEFEVRNLQYGRRIVCLTGSGTISIHKERLQISEAGRKQNKSFWNRF